MGDQRRSRPRTQRFIDNVRLCVTLFGAFACCVVIYIVVRELTEKYPLPEGPCAVAYVQTGGSATTAIEEALRELDVSPETVDVHSAALRSEIREVQPGYPVEVCVTPAKDKVASVGDVNMGG